ncbi:type II toxin-antitoxin system VapC family toxin [Ornithinimicrobium cavernae]|uniref:type II toxin-antitoxin system VapC family toxin n=1 Tax=Ornithinimicrobium cavernae TaxID=2666047 RepID=UPI000D690621|nr:type II toxin-antitoxin system VapC family toxin [Ornithinimicrobium cavernae]
MILVDTSVWIDHLHTRDSHLVEELELDRVGCHPAVIEELALGSLANRDDVMVLLGSLRRFPVLRHEEVPALVAGRRLWGRGLSAVDAHLLGSVALVEGGVLWTRDKRLRSACQEVGVDVLDER